MKKRKRKAKAKKMPMPGAVRTMGAQGAAGVQMPRTNVMQAKAKRNQSAKQMPMRKKAVRKRAGGYRDRIDNATL